jgi:glycosyltransferase involved in cell wall biosynthesis
MAPFVSIVIPMYNATAWIALTLQSVVAQSIPAERLETIIVDDQSSDDSVAMAREFLARHGMRGVVLESQRNEGAAAARNRGWAVAEGAWIQFLDADDILAPTKIELQARFLADVADDVTVVCSPWQRLGPARGAWRPYGPVIRPELDGARGGSVVLKIVALNAGFLGPALIRKTHLAAVSGFSETVKYAEDEHLMLKIAAAGGRFVEAPGDEPLFFVRQTPASKSRGSKLNLARQHIENVVMAERMLRDSHGGISPDDSKVIAGLCDWTLSQLYEHDRPAFREYLHWLRGIDPQFVPEHSFKLKLATQVLGYENAERLSLVYRRVKGRAKGWYARRTGKAADKPVTVAGR